MAKVEVRPISREKWHGKTGKESFTRPKKLQALVDGITRRYATGLDEEKRKYKTDPITREPLAEGSYLTEVEYYSKLLKADLSSQFIEGVPHPFWDSSAAVIKLENNTMIFDDEVPLDHIKIQIMKASKFVANSQREFDEGLYPEATHVITDEREEMEVLASKVEKEEELVIAASKLSKDRKIQIIMILAGKNLKGKSDNFVKVELRKLIKDKPDDMLRYINKDEEDVSLVATIREAIEKGILRKEGHKYMYFDSLIGNDESEVVDYLKAIENQEFKLRILSQLEN